MREPHTCVSPAQPRCCHSWLPAGTRASGWGHSREQVRCVPFCIWSGDHSGSGAWGAKADWSQGGAGKQDVSREQFRANGQCAEKVPALGCWGGCRSHPWGATMCPLPAPTSSPELGQQWYLRWEGIGSDQVWLPLCSGWQKPLATSSMYKESGAEGMLTGFSVSRL